MGLRERLRTEATAALKSGDRLKYETLKFLLAVLQNKEIEKQGRVGLSATLTEEEIQAVILAEIKKRQEAIAVYERAGREDLVNQERAELAVIAQYAPQQLSEAEIETELKVLLQSLGKVELGVLMKKAAETFRGRADMKVVAQKAKELLAE